MTIATKAERHAALRVRCKALLPGADLRKLDAAITDLGLDVVERLLDQVERTTTTKARDETRIAYKGQHMTTRKSRDLEPYEESAYDYCDVIDQLAYARGAQIAQKEINRAIADLAERYPHPTMTAIGAGRSTAYQIAYKAAAVASSTPTEQGITQLQAKIGNDDVDLLIGALASLSKEELLQLTQQYTPAPQAGAVPSSGDGSKAVTKATDQRFDFGASVRGELGEPDMRLR